MHPHLTLRSVTSPSHKCPLAHILLLESHLLNKISSPGSNQQSMTTVQALRIHLLNHDSSWGTIYISTVTFHLQNYHSSKLLYLLFTSSLLSLKESPYCVFQGKKGHWTESHPASCTPPSPASSPPCPDHACCLWSASVLSQPTKGLLLPTANPSTLPPIHPLASSKSWFHKLYVFPLVFSLSSILLTLLNILSSPPS